MWGMRFDISAIIYLNLLFIALHIIPNPWREKGWYQRTLKIMFYGVNFIALVVEAGDFIYFKYALKRTSSHVLGMTNDLLMLIPQIIKDFWFVILLCLGITAIVEFFYRKTHIKKTEFRNNYLVQFGLMVLFSGAFVVGARGGLQLKPISPGTAAFYVDDNRLTPLVINTSFNILYSLNHRDLEERNYFPEDKVQQLFTAYKENERHYSPKTDSLGNVVNPAPNVVVIVLESFSKEYIGFYNKSGGYTPFLDSLMENGLSFSNAYANGKHSNEGIVALTASIPVLMEDPFISCVYHTNSFVGVGSLMEKEGYQSYFFHGGNNGTMGFDQYGKSCGFTKYFGRDEYGNDDDYDGNWGIFDEPFMQFTATELTKQEGPFYALLFTLSSHHPFAIPEKYKGKFPKGPEEIHEVVGYTDYALKRFFATASKQPWFDNTLFIVTADHTGPPTAEFYTNQIGIHSIPLVFYMPGEGLSGVSHQVVQQSDVLPSILDFVGYKGKFTAFGNSIFDTTSPRYAYNYLNAVYQILDDDYVLHFDGSRIMGLFRYKQDSMLQFNLAGSFPEKTKELATQLKAIMQTHNHLLIENKLIPR